MTLRVESHSLEGINTVEKSSPDYVDIWLSGFEDGLEDGLLVGRREGFRECFKVLFTIALVVYLSYAIILFLISSEK
jgi:hypothetical protein